MLETYLRDKSYQLSDIVKFYPATRFVNDSGKIATDITNKYFVMNNAPLLDEKQKAAEA